MSLNYEVVTSLGDQMILQEVFAPGIEEKSYALSRAITNLRDQQVREALIALGWTPPPPGWRPA
jgi:hypothetical protein